MLINTVVRLGSPSGPEALVAEDVNGKISILSSAEVTGNVELYDEDGNLVGRLGEATSSDVATFYESRTEQQTLTEDGPSGPYDFGWRAKHLGWSVNYKQGLALYGELASVNQNRQNVGIEGPTSTTGTDGSPAVLIQKVAINNAPVQVNGWKSHDSPTSYVLDPTDVQEVDTSYVYADAFIQWTSDSAVVTTPGSDMNGLVEYPPTNRIIYTDFT